MSRRYLENITDDRRTFVVHRVESNAAYVVRHGVYFITDRPAIGSAGISCPTIGGASLGVTDLQ